MLLWESEEGETPGVAAGASTSSLRTVREYRLEKMLDQLSVEVLG